MQGVKNNSIWKPPSKAPESHDGIGKRSSFILKGLKDG